MKTCDFHIVMQFLIIKVFLPSTISLWNELPASAKTCPSVETFKKKLNSNLKKVPEYFHIGNKKEILLCVRLGMKQVI
jgi:hypothetical protein